MGDRETSQHWPQTVPTIIDLHNLGESFLWKCWMLSKKKKKNEKKKNNNNKIKNN